MKTIPGNFIHRLSKASMQHPSGISIEHLSGDWPDTASDIALAMARSVFDHQGITADRAVTIALGDDVRVQDLNREFRDKDTPTNVLSFPSPEVFENHLGDIILSWDTLAREADARGIKWQNHLSHLCVHGVLHLLGYDHITERDANIMEGIEVDILSKTGIDNPYIVKE